MKYYGPTVTVDWEADDETIKTLDKWEPCNGQPAWVPLHDWVAMHYDVPENSTWSVDDDKVVGFLLGSPLRRTDKPGLRALYTVEGKTYPSEVSPGGPFDSYMPKTP